MATIHPRVLAALGRALSLEFSAVQQYITHACLVNNWQLVEAADRFRKEAVEEMQHSERIIDRMLSLGVAPAASQLRPVDSANNLEGLLLANLKLEEDLVFHYTEASRFCQMINDRDNRDFFQALLEEEQLHSVDLAAWLQALQHS